MKTTKRFENAVTKLYKAFHKGKLNAAKCKHCAVGNILNNTSSWGIFRTSLGKLEDNTFNFERKKRALEIINASGYSPKELIELEKVFLNAMSIKSFSKWKKYNKKDQDRNYIGLCAVVEYLCELDGIPNVMDYTSLFETKENKPVKELSF